MKKDDQFANADQLYEDGDYPAAFGLFLSLAKKGDTSAMTRVALMYDEGRGVEQNFDKCIQWELKAAEAGDPTALINLGISFRRKGDVIRAREWFEKALQGGDGEAALELAKMYLVSGMETRRVRNYLQIAFESNSLCEASREEVEQLLSQIRA